MTEPTRSPTQTRGKSEGLTVPPRLGRESLPIPAGGGDAPDREQPATPNAVAIGPNEVEARTRFATSVHEYIRENIRLADQKATFFFTGATALIAFLYKNGVSSRWLKAPLQWNLLDVAAFIAMFAVAVGAFLALVVVIPRTPGSRRGFIFWEAIAEYNNGRDYADDVAMLTPATLCQVKAEHCHDLARICQTKYRWLRAALWVGAVGLAAALLVFLFLSVPAQPTARIP